MYMSDGRFCSCEKIAIAGASTADRDSWLLASVQDSTLSKYVSQAEGLDGAYTLIKKLSATFSRDSDGFALTNFGDLFCDDEAIADWDLLAWYFRTVTCVKSLKIWLDISR